MRIIGYDLQARQQTVAMLDTLSGELVNRIRHRTVPSSGSLASQISLSSPIRPRQSQDFSPEIPRAVKNVTFLLCTSSCTKVFTLSAPTPLKEGAMLNRNPKSSVRKTTKTGGSDPTFPAFSRPKSPWGRSRPLPHDVTVALSRPQAKVPNRSKAHIATGPLQSR